MFNKLSRAPADPILGLTEAFNADERENKVNLGVGVFINDEGITPILESVKQAEQRLLGSEVSKTYLAIAGEASYADQVQQLLFGQGHSLIKQQRALTVQTPGGTGALRIAAELMRHQLGIQTIWVSDPTWANHQAVFASAGLQVRCYRYYDAKSHRLDFAGMMADLARVGAGEAVLFHGCCHNPTGVDPSPEQWQQLAAVAAQRKFPVLFDFAYQGFAQSLAEDAFGLQLFTEKIPELMIASSFSKNFGLYNERVGALTLIAEDQRVALDALSQLQKIIRANYSNPPAHGAKVVATILNDASLRALWSTEVAQMRDRIRLLREQLVANLMSTGVSKDFSFINAQHGMFSFSGLTPPQVTRLQAEFGIYIVSSGRINVAGLTQANLPYVTEAIVQVL